MTYNIIMYSVQKQGFVCILLSKYAKSSGNKNNQTLDISTIKKLRSVRIFWVNMEKMTGEKRTHGRPISYPEYFEARNVPIFYF